jgi:Delta24-sterol reductase
MEVHQMLVNSIAEQVREFYNKQIPFRIYHGSTLSTRDAIRNKGNVIDTTRLSSVLKVDAHRKTVLVEPNVPMDALVKSTMQYGLIPPVVMELPNITVGGGFAGTSGESSSFKHGLFDCNVNWIEVVLGNGDIIQSGPNGSNDSDYFFGAAGSCGSLGVITLLELQLQVAKPFVKLTYHRVTTMENALHKFKQTETDGTLDYLDGIMFSNRLGVVITGHFADSPEQGANIQSFSRAWDPWFYLHAQSLVSRSSMNVVVEYVRLDEYLFRYDRGVFWGGAHAFRYFLTPFNRLTRAMLDPLLHTRIMNHALHESGIANRTIIQDLAFPYSTVNKFVDYLDRTLGMYPLWLCPVRPSQNMLQHPHKSFSMGKDLLPDNMLMNVGLWGMGPSRHEDFVNLNRELETKVRELHGLKCLYAHTYYTEDEFWEIYDRDWYENLRIKFYARHLPSIYEKVSVKSPELPSQAWRPWIRNVVRAMWPLNGLYGVYKALLGGDYLLGR